MTGKEVTRELMNVLSVTLGIHSRLLLAVMRDRAVNTIALRTVRVIYPNVLDVGCFSHTLDHTEENRYSYSAPFFHTLDIAVFTQCEVNSTTEAADKPEYG